MNVKQYLSIPVYTIFKNLTIILIVCKLLALINWSPILSVLLLGIWRGHLVWWKSNRSHFFVFHHYGMSPSRQLDIHYTILMRPFPKVISSIIAAWSDIANALDTTWSSQDPAAAIGGLHAVQSALTKLNIGYFWMFFNCITSAAFVSLYWIDHSFWKLMMSM